MREFVIPDKITLAGCVITIIYDETLSDVEYLGMWVSNRHEIVLNPNVPTNVQFMAFIHEVSEAIAYLCVNSPEAGCKVPHETIDGYGMGLFGFLLDNAHLMIKEMDETTAIDNG